MTKIPQFSQTYLYKVHALSLTLDKAFDRILRKYAHCTLSQFMLLMSVAEHDRINQRGIAQYLSISTVAAKRQIDLAEGKLLIKKTPGAIAPSENIELTSHGRSTIDLCLKSLNDHMFSIFDNHSSSLTLMRHLDLLIGGAQTVIAKENLTRRMSYDKEKIYANS